MSEPKSEGPEVLTAKEVAERLKCGVSTVYEMFEAGELRGFRLKTKKTKGGIRILASSIAEMMERNANRPPAKPEAEAVSDPVPARPAPASRKGFKRRAGSWQVMDMSRLRRTD
jgi:excisionase family DNA binding protein